MKGLKSLVLLFLFLLTPLAIAQDQPADFVQVVTVRVRPGAVTEYEDYVKKIIAGANKIGAPQIVFANQVILGGSGYTYHIVLPFNKWEEMDTWMSIPQILSKAYGDAEAAKILRSGRNSVESSETAVYRLLRDLSTRPKVSDSPAKYLFVVLTKVEPDMASAYELYLAKLKTAQQQAPNAPMALRFVSVQGPAHTYVTVSFFNKHAERDGWTSPQELLRKTYGEAEGRQLSEDSLRYVRERDFFVDAYRPDLSRPTGSAMGSKK